MIKLFLDIETLPGDESLRGDIAAEVRPPATITRAETIKTWEEKQKPAKVEEEYRKTALEGLQGRILCIGYLREDGHGETEGVISGDERYILTAFWELAGDVDLFVGFNVLDFDLKFIIQRSIINGVRPSRTISFARFRSEPVYDVMWEWEHWGNKRISLDRLAQALGIVSPKDGIDGSKVYDYYKEGRTKEIYDYCLRDVRATREIYRRMNFLQ